MDYSGQLDDLARNWKPPIELTRSGPRSIGLSGQGTALACLAAILLAGGVFLAAWLGAVARRQAAERQLLDEQGRDVDAAVTRLWRTGDKEHAPMVSYEFDWDGRGYSGRGSLRFIEWKTLAVGSTLTVRFLPARPELNRPAASRSRPFPFWLAMLLGASLSAGGGVLLFILRRQMALLSEARPAPGVVTAHTRA